MSDASDTQAAADGFEDKVLPCQECGKDFLFTAGEQRYFKKQNFGFPRRCKECREKRKAKAESEERKAAEAARHQTAHRVICASCGIETSVPFKPDPSRPVFCKQCYTKARQDKKRE
ncbi:MAG: zinc-ribbon domain containing protein [Planctomycetota bacterium]|nr:zinc-ribbon domain containing protein [Planctomycetota bacterium]